MNRVDRLTAILLLLLEKPYSSEQIARKFEVSKRTVLRDVQALSEMGVPVIAREGVGGGYSLPDHYRIAPLPLNSHEALLLLLALEALNRLSDAPFRTERASLSAKLRSLLPVNQGEFEAMAKIVSIADPARPQKSPFLEPLLAAAQNRHWLLISYRSAERASQQHILPEQVFTRNGLWYCLGYCAEQSMTKRYRVDRITNLAPPPATFRPPPIKPTRPYADPANPEVVIELTRRGVAWLESDTLLGPEIVTAADGSGRLVFHCPVEELDWYARYFAGFAGELTVLSPPELCRRLKQISEILAKNYFKW